MTTEEAAAGIALLADAAATRARYCDISLIGWESGNPTSRMTAETVLFGSGRPAVLLPELSGVAPLDHLAIAWDGSRVAARAVADAQPFLERASRITVLTVLDEKPLKERDAGERLVEALRRRGLAAEAASVNAEDCPIAETLQQRAIERGSDLLVMGAYGHSRVRDFVLGGATAGILSDLLLPGPALALTGPDRAHAGGRRPGRHTRSGQSHRPWLCRLGRTFRGSRTDFYRPMFGLWKRGHPHDGEDRGLRGGRGLHPRTGPTGEPRNGAAGLRRSIWFKIWDSLPEDLLRIVGWLG